MSSEHTSLLPLKKVLVATDGSKNAERAIDAAGQVAKQFSSELIVLSVVMESRSSSLFSDRRRRPDG